MITTRFILFAGVAAISSLGGFYMAMPCDKIEWMMGSATRTLAAFPSCASYVDGHGGGNGTHGYVAVLANWKGSTPEASAAYDATYGMAHWVALVLHIVGAEVYVSARSPLCLVLGAHETPQLSLTKAEHMRLRQVSYERQKAAGFANPGMAGLTADRIGDTEKWEPKSEEAI